MHKFQSTPPRGRRRSANLVIAGMYQFQSTPPRGRRPTVFSMFMYAAPVSIHASAREATSVRLVLFAWMRFVSIHASAREATMWSASIVTPEGFQSTPPRGRRLLL